MGRMQAVPVGIQINVVRASQVSGAHPLIAAIIGCSKPSREFIVSGTTTNRRPQQARPNRRSVAARGEDNGRSCRAAKVRAKHVGRFGPDLKWTHIYIYIDIFSSINSKINCVVLLCLHIPFKIARYPNRYPNIPISQYSTYNYIYI